MNIIRCKWFFKLKQKSVGTIDKYKANLVVKGYNEKKLIIKKPSLLW